MNTGEIVGLVAQVSGILSVPVAIYILIVGVIETITGQRQGSSKSSDYDNTSFHNFNSDPIINPASGLPMHGGVDVAGNAYGMNNTSRLGE